MVEKKVVVKNESGLHMRPATEIVKAATQCTSDVTIIHNDKTINAKSVLNIMSAAIKFQSEVIVRCDGENEDADLELIADIIANSEE